MAIEDFSNVCYAKTFLYQVIVRLDFLNFIPSEVLFVDEKIKTIREVFPKVSMRQIMRYNDVQVNLVSTRPEAAYNAQEGFSQSFSDQTNNKLVISNKFMVLEINQYTNFEALFDSLHHVVKVYDKFNWDVTRTGIRYINLFNEGQVKLTKKLFCNPVNALVNTSLSQIENNTMCIRSMCMNEYQVGDMRLNFRYGMYNPQYPNAMRSASFTLDYDCYCDNIISGYDEITAHIRAGHEAIQSLFEKSITDSLRNLMKNE